MPDTNTDFDFEKFATNAIKYIDSMRSYGRGTYPQESRINAFYRILGLPAVVKIETDDDKKSLNRVDKLNNGNTFDKDSGLDYEEYEDELNIRQTYFLRAIEDGEEEAFLDNKMTSIDASIPVDSSGEKKKSSETRKRGVLFPLLVDGTFFINPDTRRVSDAFVSETNMKKGYTRPLIENIIYMRLKAQNSGDSTSQDNISADFQSQFDLGPLGESALKTLDKTLKNDIPSILNKTVNKLANSRKQTGVNVVFKVANIARQNPDVEQSDKIRGELDIRKANLDNKRAIKDSVLALFEYNDTVGLSNSRSLLDTGFTSVLLSVLNPPEGEQEKEEKAVTEQVEKAKTDIKKQAGKLDLLFGEFSGISGVDILVIITALFRIEEKYLLGLLNKVSFDNFTKVRGDQTKSSVTEAEGKLREEIIKIFKELTEKIQITSNRVPTEKTNG